MILIKRPVPHGKRTFEVKILIFECFYVKNFLKPSPRVQKIFFYQASPTRKLENDFIAWHKNILKFWRAHEAKTVFKQQRIPEELNKN